jgi:hypothetical protein
MRTVAATINASPCIVQQGLALTCSRGNGRMAHLTQPVDRVRHAAAHHPLPTRKLPVVVTPQESAMNLNDLQSQVALGEDSRRQFKRDVTNVDSSAARTTSA